MLAKIPHRGRLALVAALALGSAAVWWSASRAASRLEDAEDAARPADVWPDYAGVVLPSNIAPLNFAIREQGDEFLVRFRGQSGVGFEVRTRSAAVDIPAAPWRKLLEENRGQEIVWDIFAQVEGRLLRFEPIANRVAEEPIDPILVYRQIGAVHNNWREVAIHERSLEDFADEPVLEGKQFDNGCVNCHSFAANDPARGSIGVRSRTYGNLTLRLTGNEVEKLPLPFGYTAWHPNGTMAIYSTNKVRQFFHTAGEEVRDVVDLESSLWCFDAQSRSSRPVPGASDERSLATYPAWSPDGKVLYYCRAQKLWSDGEKVPPDRYAEVKYDLMRIDYDPATDRWGSPRTVLASADTGMSVLLPRVSPDGRYLLFCQCRYGCFPAFQPSSDLYLMDLAAGSHARLDINSEFSESWHSWSSNSRWIAFSSKRDGGTYTRTYVSYIDANGRAHRPLLVPQRDPDFYGSWLKTMSVPELLSGPIAARSSVLAAAVRSGEAAPVAAPPTEHASEPYRQ